MICCIVYIDGSLTGERYTFACVPRIGESVTIPKSGNTQTLTVKNVVHVAEGAFEDEPECVVQVHASTKARRKA